MTKERIATIREVLNAEDHPGDVWFLDTIEKLCNAVDNMKDLLEKTLETDDVRGALGAQIKEAIK